MRRIIFQIHHFPDIVTRGRIRFRSVVMHYGAGPLAKMLLGAKVNEIGKVVY